jgi:hypothetical protein
VIIFDKTTFPELKKIIVVVANAEMYPWIPMELFADPMGSVGYTLGTASIEEFQYFMAKV